MCLPNTQTQGKSNINLASLGQTCQWLTLMMARPLILTRHLFGPESIHIYLGSRLLKVKSFVFSGTL